MSSKWSFPSFLEKNKILALFRESLLIIFSILFALFVNEWRANQNLEKDREKALSSVMLELENNLESLRSVMPHHKQVGDSLKLFLASNTIQDLSDGRSGLDLFFEHAGSRFREPRVQENAWRAAQLSGVLSRFDNEIIYHLSTLYELQKEGVETGWKKTVESFFDTDGYDPAKAYPVLQKLALAMANQAGLEKSLIQKYEETLEYLKEAD